jgi:hypothetical protein
MEEKHENYIQLLVVEERAKKAYELNYLEDILSRIEASIEKYGAEHFQQDLGFYKSRIELTKNDIEKCDAIINDFVEKYNSQKIGQ